MKMVLCQADLDGCDLGAVRLTLEGGKFCVDTSISRCDETTGESDWMTECSWTVGDEIADKLYRMEVGNE